MKYKKYYIIFILISFLISQEGTLAKVSFKNGTEKIGWVDVNFSDLQVRIESSDGSWASYSKVLISDIEYLDSKSSEKNKESNTKSMVSSKSDDIDTSLSASTWWISFDLSWNLSALNDEENADDGAISFGYELSNSNSYTPLL